MKCIDFKHWLLNRDVSKINLDPTAKTHIKDCVPCGKLLQMEIELEGIIKKEFLTEEVPAGVAHRIEAGLQRENDRSLFSDFHFQKLISTVAIPFVVLFFVLSFLPGDFKNLQHISNLAVQYHLKSEYKMAFTENKILEGNELLNKDLGFKVVIPNLSMKGYQFMGGRKCVLGKRDVAYMFYKHQGRINSLFILNQTDLDFEMAEGGDYKDVNKGCTIHIWKENSQVYALIN